MKHFIKQSLVALFVTGSLPAQATVLAHFSFENNYSDISGNGRTISRFGSGLSFSSDVAATNGESSRALRISPNSYLDTNVVLPVNNFTVELFAKVLSTGQQVDQFNQTHIITERDYTQTDGDGGGGFELVLYNRSVSQVNLANRTTSEVFRGLPGPALNDNMWHHIAFTFSSSQLIQFFVDGVLVRSLQNNYNKSTAANNLRIGASHRIPSSAAGFFNGLVDDVRVSSGVLPVDQFLFQPFVAPPPADVPAPPVFGLFGLSLVSIAGWYRGRAKTRK